MVLKELKNEYYLWNKLFIAANSIKDPCYSNQEIIISSGQDLTEKV